MEQSVYKLLLPGAVGVQTIIAWGSLCTNCNLFGAAVVQTIIAWGQAVIKLLFPGAVVLQAIIALGQKVYKLLVLEGCWCTIARRENASTVG